MVLNNILWSIFSTQIFSRYPFRISWPTNTPTVFTPGQVLCAHSSSTSWASSLLDSFAPASRALTTISASLWVGKTLLPGRHLSRRKMMTLWCPIHCQTSTCHMLLASSTKDLTILATSASPLTCAPTCTLTNKSSPNSKPAPCASTPLTSKIKLEEKEESCSNKTVTTQVSSSSSQHVICRNLCTSS